MELLSCVIALSLVAGSIQATAIVPPLRLQTWSSPYLETPTVQLLNGTYTGVRIPSYNQDAFLGIPYARAPVNELRFQRPQSLQSKWVGTREAKSYGPSCYQSPARTTMSEDCLHINIIRPSSSTKPLPVFVAIYGGGFYYGSSSDQAYNLSSIVSASVAIDQPIIAVSFNYRLDMWGFLSSPDIFAEKNANAGLMDQRMAFRWIQENIGAFGGDAEKVTLWGVSAGAQSIALHLHSFGGRDDGLYHAAILESGGPVGTALQALPFYEKPLDDLVKTHGCDKAQDRLSCLRKVPSETLFSKKAKQLWNPIVDNDFLTALPSTLRPLRIPLITGTNTDEGVSFSSRTATTATTLKTWLSTWRSYALTPPSIDRLIALYTNTTYEPPMTASAAIGGDMVQHSQRRKIADLYTAMGVRVWSYRFATPPWNGTGREGVKHGVETVFTLGNNTGDLGPLPRFSHYAALSEGIVRAYVGFANGFDPNGGSRDAGIARDGGGRRGMLPYWPSYREQGYGKEGVNMVLNASRIHVEKDDWRREGIEFINGISRELLA